MNLNEFNPIVIEYMQCRDVLRHRCALLVDEGYGEDAIISALMYLYIERLGVQSAALGDAGLDYLRGSIDTAGRLAAEAMIEAVHAKPQSAIRNPKCDEGGADS